MSCAMCQLFNEIETSYLNIFTVIFGSLELNVYTLGLHSTQIGIMTFVLLKAMLE